MVRHPLVGMHTIVASGLPIGHSAEWSGRLAISIDTVDNKKAHQEQVPVGSLILRKIVDRTS